jgi:D-alanine-D-alanine ligase
MAKLKVAILFGGRSVEHGVSIKSARNIFEYLDKEKFEPCPIGITEGGIWYLCESVDKEIAKGSALTLRLDPGHPEFIAADGRRVKPDVVFPVLHGTDGEDGSIQGLLKALDLPMVGTGVLGSSVSINKLVAKKILKEAGIPTADFLFNHFGDKIYSFEEVVGRLGSPLMVKSATLGSSIGVSKVRNEAEFDTAVKEAFRYDDCVIFEKFIKARELECAVLGNNPPQASLPGEIIISDQYEFYTFDAKYVDDKAVRIEVPAVLDEAISARIRDLSVQAYQALHCLDFARVDLFLSAQGEVLINEINTIPGFTNSSMFPMMWKERGISFVALISRLIEMALERFETSKRVQRGYTSDLKF